MVMFEMAYYHTNYVCYEICKTKKILYRPTNVYTVGFIIVQHRPAEINCSQCNCVV